MFLRKTSRFKDGRVHDYWRVAENSCAGRRVVQRQLLYLGESSYTSKSTLYGCLDRLVAHKDAMFGFLRDRWAGRAWRLFKIRKPKPTDTAVTQENFS